MALVIETSIIALVPGTFEGLLAIAIVLVYGSRRVVNVSLAATGALGAYLTACLAPDVGLPLSIALGLVLTVLASTAITLAVSWRQTRTWNPVPFLLTLLVAVALEQGLTRIWNRGLEFPEFLPQRVISIGHYQLTPLHVAGVAAGVTAVLLAIGIVQWLRRQGGLQNTSSGVGERLPIMTALAASGILAFASACLTAEAGFAPGFMVAPAVVATLAAAIGLFRRPEVAFIAAVGIEVARDLSVRLNVPHAGYTSGVAVVLLLAAALYVSRYVAIRTMRTG